MPEIHVTVSENGYLQINGKRAYPLSFKYAGNGLYKHILECLPAENNNLHLFVLRSTAI